jgi:hypothetical protein
VRRCKTINKIRFFESGNEYIFDEYENNILIPYINTTVMLQDRPFKVMDITYGFAVNDSDYTLIDIEVKSLN